MHNLPIVLQRARLAAPAAALAIFLMAAQHRTAQAETAPKACALYTQAIAARFLGPKVVHFPDKSSGTCLFKGSYRGRVAATDFEIATWKNIDTGEFREDVPVPNLGDRAFIDNRYNVLVVRKGDLGMTVAAYGTVTAADARALEVKLAAAFVAEL